MFLSSEKLTRKKLRRTLTAFKDDVHWVEREAVRGEGDGCDQPILSTGYHNHPDGSHAVSDHPQSEASQDVSDHPQSEASQDVSDHPQSEASQDVSDHPQSEASQDVRDYQPKFK